MDHQKMNKSQILYDKNKCLKEYIEVTQELVRALKHPSHEDTSEKVETYFSKRKKIIEFVKLYEKKTQDFHEDSSCSDPYIQSILNEKNMLLQELYEVNEQLIEAVHDRQNEVQKQLQQQMQKKQDLQHFKSSQHEEKSSELNQIG